jgi:hypothetical protein
MRWLVIRDRTNQPLEYRELWPRTDLHAIMAAAQRRLAAEGWTVDAISRNCSFFFAARAADNARVCVSIECFEPVPPRRTRVNRSRTAVAC